MTSDEFARFIGLEPSTKAEFDAAGFHSFMDWRSERERNADVTSSRMLDAPAT
jgi:hypothetical protein